jgi:NAD(P)-dependent dehydrogenase (short-subunit alcohol dehydrogenase family)
MAGSIFDLSDKVAVVTGGNRGIGLGIARGLARQGASLAIWSRDKATNAAAVQELEGLGAKAIGVPCDVASEAAVEAAAKQTIESFGRIDICFANAGFGAVGRFLKMSLDEWHKVTSVDLDGAFMTFREAAKDMVARGEGGKLVAITSITEWFGTPLQPHYAASKAGVGALVRSLAVQLGRHDIQVNAIQPGWIETDATAPAMGHEGTNNAVLKRTPIRRWGKTEDLEGIAIYLASDASRYHTGDTIRVDGGYSIF